MEKQQKSSGGNDNATKEQFVKRNSLFGDEILQFDPSELDDDDWRDVFDDDDQPTDDVFSDDNDDDNDNDPSALMPPPADKKMASTIASFNLGDKPVLDQSKKRRRSTAAQIERTENWAPAQMWDSEAADIPHRQAMIQAMYVVYLYRYDPASVK